MKKVILASTCAVIIVLASLTSVVGFQSKTDNDIATPLFNIRTNRAIGNRDRFTCDYLGKGKDASIPLPTYKGGNGLLQRIIDVIDRMDDSTFNRFMDEVDNKEVASTLQRLRDNPNIIIEQEGPQLVISAMGHYSPGCIIGMIFDFLFMFIVGMLCLLGGSPTVGFQFY